ncbi:FUSC family protein [Paraburkholderia sp. BCC1884]|uniref:FUSC family protein n=1 Tax=Paraburkholderia sp. BCC1884 TaxID=2562668 RepID=UPI0011833DC4|nr:FUSC family protein [Paraburkholderia sp. BCC1884]
MIAILDDLRKELVVYRKDEYPRVLHAFKTALAVIVSMLICMRLELRTPGTAMVSAAIVMIPQQSGMTIGRAFYRVLGFCCGSIVGFLLISNFAQQPVLFLAGLSVWVGFCVAGSSYYKNFQSYGFVLSGYVACITTVPEWPNPYDVTTNIIYVVSEVVIGVATGSLVSALVFPQKVVPALVKWRDSALAALLPALREAAQGEPSNEQIESYMKLIQESVSIEALRTAAVFEEPEMRLRNDSLLTLDRTFLDVITRIHAVYRARQHTTGVDIKIRGKIDELFGKLVAVTADVDPDALQTQGGLEHLHSRLRILEEALPVYVDHQVLDEESHDAANARILETVGAEVFVAVSSLRQFCDACMVVLEPPTVHFTQPIVQAIAFMRSAPIRASGTAAILSGLRATTAVGIVGAVWIASGWTNGYNAVVSAGITSGFFSITPTPVKSSWQAVTGCFFAMLIGCGLNFFVMPRLGDISLFAICIGIVIFFGTYINSFPKYTGLGAIFNVYFGYVLSPTNVAVYDPPYLLDRSFALLIGIAVSAVAFSLVIPREGELLARQYTARIHELLEDAASGDIDSEDSEQMGVTIRDLIVHIVTVPNVTTAYREQTTEWAFGQLWIASTLIQMRSLCASQSDALPQAWGDMRRIWLKAMETVAQNADAANIQAALDATQQSLSILRTRSEQLPLNDSRTIFQMRARLYSTLAALQDRLPAVSTENAVTP